MFYDLIFFITYEWAQKDRVSHYIRLERHARGKHYSLLGPLVSYKEKEGLSKGTVFKTLHFLCDLHMGPIKLECHSTLGWKDMSGTNTPAYWAHL